MGGITAEEVRDRLRMMAQVDIGEWELSDGQRGAIVGTLNKMLGDDAMRYLFLGWLFRSDIDFAPLSSKELKPGHWYALWNWIGYSRTDDGLTLVSDLFHHEYTIVLTAALKALADASKEIQRRFGDQAFDVLSALFTGEGAQLTHTFDERQDVQYDFTRPEKVALPESALDRQRKLIEEAREARQRELMRELGYDVDAPENPIVNF